MADAPATKPGTTIDLSGLSGAEVTEVARTLVSGHLETVLKNKDLIAGLDIRQVQTLVDLAGTRANCGGFGCG